MALSVGRRIGNYEVLGPAGAGGMGEVYRARDLRLGRTVAIKALPAGMADDPARIDRLEREAKLLASLNHPNIAGIHGVEDAEGGPYLVLEFIEGETLAQRLARGPLTVTETVHLGAQIAAAVDAAHERNIIHRDLKPANVMITSSGHVKVLDFGLARDGTTVTDDDARTVAVHPTAEGVVLGTAPYMSPEQARGKPVDKRVDVWAFGCILMECLTGRQVFPGETPSDVIAGILQAEPGWDRLPAATPPRLLDILRRCLTKDVNLRPRDIGDLGRELKSLVSDSSSSRGVKAVADLPSLAVLYFRNLARDPDSEYFCTGITEDILSDLSKIKGLRVASKNAVSRYQGADVDLTRLGVDLGVTAVLEGTVRRAGDRIRITTQLINVADGFQLWGERFDRTLDDVFAVQDEIATSIVNALRVTMSPSDIKEIARERPADAKAYDLYLKGRQKYREYNREAMQEAMDLFREAIALEPNYALAWAGVADCYGQFLQYDWTDDREEFGRLGLEAARKAVALDPNLPEAYKAEATVLTMTHGDRGEVLRTLRRAIEVDPNFVPALINLGVQYFIDGNLAAAERLCRRTHEIDPQQPHGLLWLSWLLYWTNRYEESLTVARRLLELWESDFYLSLGYFTEILCLLAQGDIETAAGVLARAQADHRVDSDKLMPAAALLELRRGRLDEARSLAHRTTPETLHNGLALAAVVEIGITMGESELPIAAVNRLAADPYLPMLFRLTPGCHPVLDREPFAPRKAALTLTWPLQAPMIDEARYALFEEVRIKSGRPEGTELLESRPSVS